MAEQSDNAQTPARPAGENGAGGGNRGGGGGVPGSRVEAAPLRVEAAAIATGTAIATATAIGPAQPSRAAPAAPAGGAKGSGGGQRKAPSGSQRQGGGANRSGANRSRSRPPSGQGGGQRGGPSRAAVAVAPAPLPALPVDEHPGLGAARVSPGEVASNRRRAVRICALTAVFPAILVGVLLAVVAAHRARHRRLCDRRGRPHVRPVAHRAVDGDEADRAVPVEEDDYPRLFNVTDGLCATFGLAMPALYVLDDDVPNACALGRDARRSELVVTSGLLRRLDPIQLEGVIAHELAHVKRGDNGVSCVGITLGTFLGGERTLRRCVGENREYRADVVGASAVRYPQGLLEALEIMMAGPAPAAGSLFASPARFGATRWVWIDPFVGHRDDSIVPGDLDRTSVRAAALARVVRRGRPPS